MVSASTLKRNAVCNTCTRRLIVIAYQQSPWFRLVREPLKLIMCSWVKLCQINPGDYEVRSPSCYGCIRFYKLTLKESSALFRLLNNMVNPFFDILLERIVTKEEVNKAKAHAHAAIAGEKLLEDDERYVSDWHWWKI